MLVETGNDDIEQSLTKTASLLRATGGFISDRLIVREQDGHFSCAVTHDTTSGELLVRYNPQLSVPMHLVEWAEDSEALTVSRLPEGLTQTQRGLLDAWVAMVNAAEKLPRVRRSLPRFVINSWPLRHHLADAGYPSMRERTDLSELHRITVNWHCGGMQENVPHPTDGDTRPGMALIPLKHLVNHHPHGAHQRPVPGQVAVVSGVVSGTDETFENYGDLDAMKLLLGFGFYTDIAPLVHSVPVSVPSPVGRISVDWLAPRGGRAGIQRDVPQLRSDDEGLVLHDLTFRPDNRDRTAALLAMALTARGVGSSRDAHRQAQEILSAVVAANLEYYRTLDNLVIERREQLGGRSGHHEVPAEISADASNAIAPDLPPLPSATERALLNDLAMVSLTQQDKMRRWWS